MPKTFVLSNGELNRYGYRVRTDGIELENFRKNPVMFYNHNDYRMPIGKWDNIRVENGQLMADAVFDEKDETGKEVARKVDSGILNATSIGFRVLETSETDVLQGQRRSTVSRAELTEASIVAIPANPTALKLEYGGLQLLGTHTEAELDYVLPKLKGPETPPTPPNTPPGTDQTDWKLAYERSVEALVELGKKTGRIMAANERAVRKLAQTDVELALELMDGPGPQSHTPRLSQQLGATPPNGTPQEPTFLTFDKVLDEIRENQRK